jgi:hypothetical protein
MLSWSTPLYSFLRSRLRPFAPPRSGYSTLPTFVLGSPRTPVFHPETGTRPSLPAGRPAARTRPSPLTSHAPHTRRSEARAKPSTPTCLRHPGVPTRNRTRRPDRDSRTPVLGSPRAPSDSGLSRRLDPKASTLTLLDELGDDRTLGTSRPLLRPRLASAPEGTPPRLVGSRTHGLGDLSTSGPGEVHSRTRDASESTSSAGSGPLLRPTRTASRRCPFSLGLGAHERTEVHPLALTPGALKYASSYVSPGGDRWLFWGFLPPRDLATAKSPPALAYRYAPRDAQFHREGSLRLR